MTDALTPSPDDSSATDHVPPAIGAAHLLDRESPEEYRREWTDRIASPVEAVEVGTASVMIFRLGSEWLAVRTGVFQEVAEPSAIHTVPHRRDGALLGLVNVRGELLLCTALSGVLGLQAAQTGATGRTIYERLLVVNKKGSRLTFLVDEVYGVHLYHPRELLEVPSTLSKAAKIYVARMLPWNNRTVGCIDDDTLFAALNGSFA
jgi:chemotaxis-related protein WspD